MMSRWHSLVALAFLLFLGIQIVVPIVQLREERPAHFGWQMFSAYRHIPRYWIVLADGSTREIDITEHVGVRRLDADHHGHFPQYLRRRYPEAVAVRWQWPDSEEVEELQWPR